MNKCKRIARKYKMVKRYGKEGKYLSDNRNFSNGKHSTGKRRFTKHYSPTNIPAIVTRRQDKIKTFIENLVSKVMPQKNTSVGRKV